MPKYRIPWSETHSIDIEASDENEADEKWFNDVLSKSKTRTEWERYEIETISE